MDRSVLRHETQEKPNNGGQGMKCAVNGCLGKAICRGWCKLHYKRWLKHGDVGSPDPYFHRPIQDRLLQKIKPLHNGCWRWTDSLIMKGYGGLKVNGRMIRAHRAFYELFKESIPPKLTIDHLCRHTWCVNPDHLEAVTNKENILRGNGAAAINALKVQCINGHPFNKDNTYIAKNGHRVCRECARRANRTWYWNQKRGQRSITR